MPGATLLRDEQIGAGVLTKASYAFPSPSDYALTPDGRAEPTAGTAGIAATNMSLQTLSPHFVYSLTHTTPSMVS